MDTFSWGDIFINYQAKAVPVPILCEERAICSSVDGVTNNQHKVAKVQSQLVIVFKKNDRI